MVGEALEAAEEDLQAQARTAHLGLHQRGPTLTLYLDSSALAKLFLDEPSRGEVLRAMEDTAVQATSRLSYVECASAFARAEREGRASRGEVTRMIRSLDEAWRDLAVVELDAVIAERAAAITRDHPLRASDAIHLASARAVAPATGSVTFASFDRRPWEAASQLGLDRLPASPPRGP